MIRGETLTNALVGAVVTIFVTPFLPFAPLFGGAVSGYLQGGGGGDGVRVGALAGVLAVAPLLFFLALLGNLFVLVFSAMGVSTPELAGIGITLLVLFFVAVLVYVVLVSALGGLLGSYLKGETQL